MSAQDEFNALLNNNKGASRRDSLSDRESDLDDENPEPSMPSRTTGGSGGGGGGGGGGGNTYIPNTIYDANTGPKGVIADAQAFERAKKTSFRRTLLNATGLSSSAAAPAAAPAPPQIREPSPSSNDDRDERDEGDEDDEFMRRWRASRMHELQNQNQSQNGNGRMSPRRRVYGFVEDVDAGGYLDAIEMVSSATVVVVCIYDPESPPSNQIEKTLTTLAPHHPTTRFVKLHHEIAEMNHIQPPALLAYRGAEVFATLVDVLDAVERRCGNGRSMSEALGDLLREHRVL